MQTKTPQTRARPGDKYIYIAYADEKEYVKMMQDTTLNRQHITAAWKAHPELFDGNEQAEFEFHASYHSKKLGLSFRRIKFKRSGAVYTIRPSFVMPYMTGKTDEVEKAMYLRHWNVSYEALAHLFGKNAMYWYRMERSLGRPALVGTTVKDPNKLPQHLVADEKFSWVNGERVYVPVTVGGECILGIDVTAQADTTHLAQSYGQFASEARRLNPEYRPSSICLDGWRATQEVWRSLYPQIAIILCFLHSVLGIREVCSKAQAYEVLKRVWEVFKAGTQRAFSQRLRRVAEWSSQTWDGKVASKIQRMQQNAARFTLAFKHADAHRTSNAVDRAIDHLDRRFYAMRYGHSNCAAFAVLARSIALQYNFHPFGARLRAQDPKRLSRFADLNGYQYHACWLHNLLIASSRGGYSATHKFR